MDELEKIRQHHWKERLKVSKIAKFEIEFFKTNKDIAPQSREILQTFVWGAHTNVCTFSQLCRSISIFQI